MQSQESFDFGPGIPRSGVALKQDFHGFAQFREDEHSLWKFYVSSFDSTTSGDGQCAVLLSDGGLEWVSIDGENRICINGRKYGNQHWTH